jgi:hypothetical protein
MSHHSTRVSTQNQAVHGIATYLMAIGCARLRPVEMMILLITFLKSILLPRLIWNERKSRPVKLGGTMLGWSSYNINDINKSIVHLCECRVLSRESAGKYRIVVDWKEWLMGPEGEARIRPVCATAITSLDWSHECPPPESSTIDSDEPAAAPTSDLSAPSADATEAILDDSGALRAGAYPEPSDYAPARNCYAPVSRNGNCDAPPGRCNGDLQSYSSLHSESESLSFSSSDIYKSSVMEDTTGNTETYIYQKKNDLASSTNGNGLKSASMLPKSESVNPTVQANPVPSLESSPVAPSTNGIMPASMLEEIPGPESPDDALWVELKYMCNRFFPGCDFDLQFARWRRVFPTAVMVGAFKRCFVKNIIGKHNIMHAFSYVLKVMQSWNGPGIEAGFDRDMNRIPVEVPGSLPAAPASESTNVDPYAEFRANHSPAMLLEWMKDNNVSMENNPPKKDSPNGKLIDDDDYRRRMSIRARDPDRFRKLAMGKYCPSLILESES